MSDDRLTSARHVRQRLGDEEVAELAARFEDWTAQQVLAFALDRFHPDIAISIAGGAEGVSVVDMAWRINPDVRVVTLDTGRLPEETYALFDRLRDRYGIDIEVQFPSASHVRDLVHRHGPNPMYKSVELRLLCCQVRKVLPLAGFLAGVDAWITGLKRDQWGTRHEIAKVEIDKDHGGIVKFNPVADWSKQQIWDYIRANNVPYHALFDAGYTSLGCAPCTRPVAPGEGDRDGRWWWEKDTAKECGIHYNVPSDGLEQELHQLLGHDAPTRRNPA